MAITFTSKKPHPSAAPDFIPRGELKKYLTAGDIGRYIRVDGIRGSSYIAREARLGRPFPSRDMGPSPANRNLIKRGYRLIDVIVRARAHGLSIESTQQHAESLATSERHTAYSAVIQARPLTGEVHKTGLSFASSKLTGERLLTRRQIVSAAIPYSPPCGVYFLICNDEVMYVGQSVDIPSRIRQHSKNFTFDAYSYIPCAREKLDLLESLYIHYLSPEWNGKIKSGYIYAPMSLGGLLGLALIRGES